VYIEDSTFTIVAVDVKEREKGVAICTYRPAVGNRAPFARSGAGAVATQAHTNPHHGPRVLELLAQGLTPERAIELVLEDDPDRDRRQLLCVDAKGRGGAFTGSYTQEWKGHRVGEGYVVGGNMLTGPEVLTAMAATFESSTGPLYVRLLKALRSGLEAGGDRRGSHSAALVVAKPGFYPYIDLRVDFDPDPLTRLEYITQEYIKRILE